MDIVTLMFYNFHSIFIIPTCKCPGAEFNISIHFNQVATNNCIEFKYKKN